MSDKKLEVIKNLQQAEAIYVIMSGFTKMPYVACDEETFDDKVWRIRNSSSQRFILSRNFVRIRQFQCLMN